MCKCVWESRDILSDMPDIYPSAIRVTKRSKCWGEGLVARLGEAKEEEEAEQSGVKIGSEGGKAAT